MIKKLFYSVILFGPFVVFAAAPQNLLDLIDLVKSYINPIIGLLTGLAVLFFIMGIVRYIANAGDEKKAKEGKSIMIYGVLALFILFSFWGIVQLFYNSIFN